MAPSHAYGNTKLHGKESGSEQRRGPPGRQWGAWALSRRVCRSTGSLACRASSGRRCRSGRRLRGGQGGRYGMAARPGSRADRGCGRAVLPPGGLLALQRAAAGSPSGPGPGHARTGDEGQQPDDGEADLLQGYGSGSGRVWAEAAQARDQGVRHAVRRSAGRAARARAARAAAARTACSLPNSRCVKWSQASTKEAAPKAARNSASATAPRGTSSSGAENRARSCACQSCGGTEGGRGCDGAAARASAAGSAPARRRRAAGGGRACGERGASAALLAPRVLPRRPASRSPHPKSAAARSPTGCVSSPSLWRPRLTTRRALS
jgi:hypothetical protein